MGGGYELKIDCCIVEAPKRIDKLEILRPVHIEVRSVNSVYEGVCDIQKAHINIGIKAIEQERQNILCANSLKARGAAIDVRIYILNGMQVRVPTIVLRRYVPDTPHEVRSLRPA